MLQHNGIRRYNPVDLKITMHHRAPRCYLVWRLPGYGGSGYGGYPSTGYGEYEGYPIIEGTRVWMIPGSKGYRVWVTRVYNVPGYGGNPGMAGTRGKKVPGYGRYLSIAGTRVWRVLEYG